MGSEQLRPEASCKHIGGRYRRSMASKVIVGTVMLATVLCCNQQQQVAARPAPTSIDTSEQQYNLPTSNGGESSTLSLQQNDPIRAIHYHFDQRMEPFMQLHKFNSTTDENSNTVTCNDGSPIGYYKRLNSHSKSWIIYLQGGGYCGGEEACQHRWRHSPHLMSSNYWSKLKSVDGILSSEPKDNPYLWNANHIYVPYCSSDSWTGLQAARTGRSPTFAFMGSRIIEKVLDSLFDDLPREASLYESKFVLLAGDSAGATGVILNLDKVNRLVQQRFSSASAGAAASVTGEQPHQAPVLRGLADSGWFLDNEPYDYAASLAQEWPAAAAAPFVSGGGGSAATGDPNETDCDRQRCTPLQSIRQAMLYWNGQVPAACALRQQNEPWRCYFGYRAYQSLKTPLFVVQWLYDEAQLMVDNIIRPDTVDQWNYVNKLVSEMRHSLENVSALFAPSCFSHSLVIKQSWNQININGFRLPHILNSWEEEVLSNQPTLDSLLAPDLPEQAAPGAGAVSAVAVAAAAHQGVDGNQAAGGMFNRNSEQSTPILLDERRFQHGPTATAINFELRTVGPRPANYFHGNQQTASASQTTNSRHKGRKKRRNNNNSSSSNNNNNNSNNNHNGNSQHASNRIATLTNRLSRSTSVLDEAAPVFNNNVPEVLIVAASKQQEGAEKFRLIDTCGWPQCNRDCPYLDHDFNLRPILPY